MQTLQFGLAAQRAALVQGQDNLTPAIDPRVAQATARAKEFLKSAQAWSRPDAESPPSTAESSSSSGAQAGANPQWVNSRDLRFGAGQNFADTPRELSDRELLARTIQMEAGSESYEGMLGVGAVIANRTRDPRWGNSLHDVILQPGQFSPFNKYTGFAGGEQGSDRWRRPATEAAYRAADEILSGNYRDPTGGADHFVNLSISQPSWANTLTRYGQIGGHTFFGS